MRRLAVVLLNLGGPDRPEAIRPFLFNLFNDPAILRIPNPFRWLAANLIAARRAPIARKIYAEIGGSSPLLANTRAQASALEAALSELHQVRVFCCMRYWHPMTAEVVREVAEFHPNEIVLLPLYPQFSSTTTASSYTAWTSAAGAAGLDCPTKLICCYPTEPAYVEAIAGMIAAACAQLAQDPAKPGYRVLYSAHGLPKRIVERGDPYPRQVERTAAAISARRGLDEGDWVVCYQSRVGPLKWIGPSTESEIERAGHDRLAVILAPIAFVSEHSETLVELDIQYRELAVSAGVVQYLRVPAVGTSEGFIAGLAQLVRRAVEGGSAIRSGAGPRQCDSSERCCLMPG